MSSFITAGSGAIALLGLLAIGVPVAYSLGIVASIGLYLVVGERFLFATLETLPYALASQYTFVVLPLFVFMGALSARIGLITDLYRAAYSMTAAFKGGLYTSTILASAGFGAISGSTVVSAAVFARITLPEMKRYGYNLGVAAGCVAAAGTLAAMIPPSLAMVLFGIMTNESIGALLLAGILPGLLTASIYIVGIRILIIFFPAWAPRPGVPTTWREKADSLRPLGPAVLLEFVVLGGLYGGAFSASSAGAVGAAGVLAIGLFRRALNATTLAESIRESLILSAKLFAIIIAGLLFSRFLISSGLTRTLSEAIAGSGMGIAGFMALVIVVYLLIGMFVDGVSVLVITLPLLYPIAKDLGVDFVWFGVIVVKLIEIAAITPPVGLNLFAVLGSLKGEIKSSELFRGVVPFIALELLTLSILLSFPSISTFIPNAVLER